MAKGAVRCTCFLRLHGHTVTLVTRSVLVAIQEMSGRTWRQLPRSDGPASRPEESSTASGAATSRGPDGQDPLSGEGDPWAAWNEREQVAAPLLPDHYGGKSQKESKSGWDDSGWEQTGWLTDAELRGFNVAKEWNTTAMNNGRWAGSYDQGHGGSHWEDWDGRGGPGKPTERLVVPDFGGDGDEQDVGKSARSYLRRVQVWLRCTKMVPTQRALALYNALTGKAWVMSEELDVDLLASEQGVPYFLEWIQTRFMDLEVTKISQMMGDLFRRCKRWHDQSVREFNVEFERMVLRLHEVQCELPPLVKAWLYVDKLRLSENEELALLASVGNVYDVRKLQQAAMVQDRGLRRPSGHGDSWEKGGTKKSWNRHSVHLTEHEPDEASSEASVSGDDDNVLVEESIAEAAHTAYVTYQGAKSRYKEAMKGRGVDVEEMKKRNEERLKLAKQRSFCSACKRRGHWHKDPECPLRNKAGVDGKPKEVNFTVQGAHLCHTVHEVHTCYMTVGDVTQSNDECKSKTFEYEPMFSSVGSSLLAIVDTACTKSVAGYDWFERYYQCADEHPFELIIVEEVDFFKFGASRVHKSEFAVWCWFGLAGKWFAVRVSIVGCSVPLLFSRQVLEDLKVTYDIAAGKASLGALGLQDLRLERSETGHPAFPVSQYPAGPPPDQREFGEAVVWVPGALEVYTEHGVPSGALGCQSLFYPKKVPREVENMLRSSPLSPSSFHLWWKHANQSRDFWVETEEEFIRVHVMPRKKPFDPFAWNTSLRHVKEALLHSIGSQRISEIVPCLGDGVVLEVQVDDPFSSITELAPHVPGGQWIGRSRFLKQQPGAATTAAFHVERPAFTMEDEEARASGGAHAEEHHVPSALVGARAPGDRDGGSSGGGADQGGRRDEGHREYEPGPVGRHGEVTGPGGPGAPYAGLVHEDGEGCQADAGGDGGALWQVSRMALSGSSCRVSPLGGDGVSGQQQRSSRPGAAGAVGEPSVGGVGEDGAGGSAHGKFGVRPRGPGEDAASVLARPGLGGQLFGGVLVHGGAPGPVQAAAALPGAQDSRAAGTGQRGGAEGRGRGGQSPRTAPGGAQATAGRAHECGGPEVIGEEAPSTDGPFEVEYVLVRGAEDAASECGSDLGGLRDADRARVWGSGEGALGSAAEDPATWDALPGLPAGSGSTAEAAAGEHLPAPGAGSWPLGPCLRGLHRGHGCMGG